MIKKLHVKLEGKCNLVLHNSQAARPGNQFKKAMAEITSKRKKTDEDYILLANIEWLSAWYFSGDEVAFTIKNGKLIIGDHGNPIIPDRLLFAMLIASAKKNKLGTDFKAGIFIEDDGVFRFEPDKPVSELIEDLNFRVETLEKVTTSKIMRTRPKFKSWRVEFSISYDDSVVSESQIEQALEVGGNLVGLAERRPQWGRFSYTIIPNGSSKKTKS